MQDSQAPQDPAAVVETIRQLRLAALYPPSRQELATWIITAKDLLEGVPEGPDWAMAIGYIDGMISLFNRRYGDEAPMLPPYRPPFAGQPLPRPSDPDWPITGP